MSTAKTNPWGPPPVTAIAPVKLHDVMDEELAAKLQREEEEEWEREIAAQFGDRHNVGWCFVEVPSTDCEYGVMSVVQQEVPMEEQNGDPNDPDYAFALELQAQEAEEYDRLRRQEASSIERIQVMQQNPYEKKQQPLLNRSFRSYPATSSSSSSSRSRRPQQNYQLPASSNDIAMHIEESYEYESDDETDTHDHHTTDSFRDSDCARKQDHRDGDDEDTFLEDELPIGKFNSLDIKLRGSGRNYRSSTALPMRPSSSSSFHGHGNLHHSNHSTRK